MKSPQTHLPHIEAASLQQHIKTIRKLQSLLLKNNLSGMPASQMLEKALYLICHIYDCTQPHTSQKLLTDNEIAVYKDIHLQLDDIGSMTVMLCDLSANWNCVTDIFNNISTHNLWQMIKLQKLKCRTKRLGKFFINL